MTQVCSTTTEATSPNEGMTTDTTRATERVDYATANDVYAGLRGGGSVSVEEFPEGDIVKAAEGAARMTFRQPKNAALVLGLGIDDVGEAAHNVVWFHSDESERLAVIGRARAALDDAEAALLACGYVDNAHRRSA